MARETNGDAKLSYDNPIPRCIFAGFLAVVLHMSFLLFANAPDHNPGSDENVKFVTLLPLNTKIPSEQVILQWMDLMNPTGVVKPDRKNGFSVALKEKLPPDEKMVLKKHYSQLETGAFLPLNPLVESSREKVRRFWEYSSAGVSNPGYREKKLSVEVYPLWLSENGKLLPQFFRDVRQVKELLAKQKTPLNETILKWESNGPCLFPRVKLDVSCGNPELDKLAIKTLTLKGKEFLNEFKKGSEPGFIAIKWGK